MNRDPRGAPQSLCRLASSLVAALTLLPCLAPAQDTAPLPFVSPIFGDKMVLQRGKPNAIWGWSQPGDTVRIEVGESSATATAGADGRWVAGTTWNTPWSTFGNPCCAQFVVAMANGVVGHYEMSHVARGHTNDWHREAYRVEGERGSVILDADGAVRLHEHLGGGRERVTELEAELQAAVIRAELAASLPRLADGAGKKP